MKVRAIFPQPMVSLFVFGTWLLAQNAPSLGNVLLGALLGVAIPRLSAKFWVQYPASVRYRPLLRLFAVVVLDILIANFRVASLVLGPSRRQKPRFIEVPLALRSPHAITLLASTISLTPGTVSANLSGDRRTLLVHGLAIDDADAAVALIKRRYEAPIREAFEC